MQHCSDLLLLRARQGTVTRQGYSFIWELLYTSTESTGRPLVKQLNIISFWYPIRLCESWKYLA